VRNISTSFESHWIHCWIFLLF